MTKVQNMHMTGPHFAALAAALASTRPPQDGPPTLELLNVQHQWHMDRQAILNACAAANSHFNSDRFIAATLIDESAQ